MKRLAELLEEKKKLGGNGLIDCEPPRIDIKKARYYMDRLEKTPESGSNEDKKAMVRECVDRIKLAPEARRIEIMYRIPGSVMIINVAGGGFEPPTSGL